MVNIATVQLQDYFHHRVFDTVITRRDWSRFESRLTSDLDETLTLLSRYGVKATFFTLGWIAERSPDLVQQIARAGHEIASAGFWGVDRNAVSQKEFREDLRKGKEILEEVTGLRVDGFRCIRRALRECDLWQLDLIAREGYRYDSSVLPSAFSHGTGKDSLFPFERTFRKTAITELPHTTTVVGRFRIPVGGGNFLRQLPPWFAFRAFRSWVDRGIAPFMLYFHPWELDPEQPEVSAFGTLTRIRQYRNLGKMRELLPRYFESAPFGTAAEYLCLFRETVSHPPAREPSPPAEIQCASQNLVAVAVVVPCHNESATISFLKRALDELIAAGSRRYDLHCILVDDHSTDNTLELLRTAFVDSAHFTVVALSENRGVSGAIHAGIDAAQTEIVCSIDADCSYDPLELLKMIPMLKDSVAMVTASPYHPDGAVLGVPRWRLFLSRSLSGIYRFVLRHKLSTYTSCFRVYRKRSVQPFRPEHGDFRGIVELLAKLDMAGHSIVEYPTTLESRVFGYSKMRTLKTVRDHLRLLARMPSYRRTIQPAIVERRLPARERKEAADA